MNFKRINIVLEDKVILTSIEIKNGKIYSIGKTADKEGFDYPEYYLVPGFIDIHIHGSNGADTMDGTEETFQIISESLIKEGTTSFLATTMTASKEAILTSAKIAKHAHYKGAQLLGLHVEGPFLHPLAKGAQNERYLTNPSVAFFDEINQYANIKVLTIAPELPHGLELIQHAANQGVVASIGHTKATYQEVLQAIKAGAKQVTHGYNAMTPFTHREPGVVGAMLLHNELNAELIADGIHVSKEAIQLLYRNKTKEHIILITDAIRAKNLKDGIYDLGGQDVHVCAEEARLTDGTLAGSILTMNHAIRNMKEFCAIPLQDAVYMATVTPAKTLGIYEQKGSIQEGKVADLVVLDQHFAVKKTIISGEIVYESN